VFKVGLDEDAVACQSCRRNAIGSSETEYDR